MPEDVTASGHDGPSAGTLQPALDTVATPAGSTRAGEATETSRLPRDHAGEGDMDSAATNSEPDSGRAWVRSRPSVRPLGAGLVALPESTPTDPAAAVLPDPEVPENKRFCWKCSKPVGRSDSTGPARPAGTCGYCGASFNFRPLLGPGEVVADQYEVQGCLAYGGLGWIYLAHDYKVSRRWVVLKGLQNPLDFEASVVALAERQFLSDTAYPAIVKIFNFVTHRTVDNIASGYIVMEYVGGRSLKTMLDQRAPQRLPVAEAIAYVMEVLPALDYLHSYGLAYNDLKPDNIMVTTDEVKLIDLGAVAALQSGGSLYGTRGYQAPEYAETGPTIASDIYTVGRTLAALTLDIPTDAEGRKLPGLPSGQNLVLRRYPTFERFLRRATDPDPAQRFPSILVLHRQLDGVLRAVLAEDHDRGYPMASTVFGTPRGYFGVTTLLRQTDGLIDGRHRPPTLDATSVIAALPIPLVDSLDPSAELVSPLLHGNPTQALETLRLHRDNMAAGVVPEPESFELEGALTAIRADLDLGAADRARAELGRLRSEHHRDWRIDWYTGLADLSDREFEGAYTHFDRVLDRVPGEVAPQLALAATAELILQASDEIDDITQWSRKATEHYRAVWRVDRGMASAAFGLARRQFADGNRAAAVMTLQQVPDGSRHYNAARLTACLLVTSSPGELDQTDLSEAAVWLQTLGDDPRRLQIQAALFGAAMAWLRAGGRPEPQDATILGFRVTEEGLSAALESTLRSIARISPRRVHRYALVDLANRVRPRSWW
ncbi:tetratricopeptide repeat protein [Nocardia sp. CA-107356]|uniref:serine/threonine-protein kinase n=1 Tax=Nocardia sp. CA-107356 TaxID=3239972 RepID=UPI003D8E3BF9